MNTSTTDTTNEVAKLNHQLLKTESDLLESQDINGWLDSEFQIANKRALKAEAEVESLQQQIKNMQEIIDDDTKQKTELHNEVARLRAAAQAVVDRWETPLWKDAEPTASVIYRLRDAIASRAEDVLKLHRPHEGSVWAKHGLSEPTEPAPEWRELGPDEVIQEGDCWEVYGELKPVTDRIGWKIYGSENYPIRTRRPLPTSQDNEVARLREELAKAMSMIDSDMECEAEVARLRELLNRAIEIADKLEVWHYSAHAEVWVSAVRQLAELKAEARLSPAPEEPANPTCFNTTHKFSHCDCKEPVSLDPVSKVTHEGNIHAKIESTKPVDEVSKLKAMVKDAARRGNQMATHWKERAEKAEAEVEFWKAKAYEAEHSEGKHEAEVERLKESIQSITKIGIDTESEKWKLMEEVERLKEQLTRSIEIADRACNLLNLKGDHHESHELRNELSNISE